ncbi:MAG: dTMP kinase [Verrucomicrobia subdivision 3 bacterium]|nr:dTMP kinase [Limisphaerales bacterium]
MEGHFITFEGTEGCGKSTQIDLLATRLRERGLTVRTLREPGGTPIGEEIRHTLQHSLHNNAMTPEAELLLINASRAQLVREVLRPALAGGEFVLCDRFYDSTVAYQGYGRGLDLEKVRSVIDFAVGSTRPELTILLHVSVAVSEARREKRLSGVRDRMEDLDRAFFERVEKGFLSIAAAEPKRVRLIDAMQSVEQVQGQIWKLVEPLL